MVIESEEKKDNFKSKISLVPDLPRCLASSKLVKSSRDLIGRCRKDISAKTSIGGLQKHFHISVKNEKSKMENRKMKIDAVSEPEVRIPWNKVEKAGRTQMKLSKV